MRSVCARAMCVLAAVLLLSPSTLPASQQSLNDLSGPWQLFVDDYGISGKTGVVRTYHPFQKYTDNPVLLGDRPWEYGDRPGQGIVYLYGTVLPDESGPGYRMWYACLPYVEGGYTGSNTLYATSTDGINWTKPNLGIRTWNGSSNNNMFYDRDPGSGITSVMHTPWDAEPARQYRFMNYEGPGFWASYAPDGISTVDAPGNPVFPGGSDVGQFMWDTHTQRYRGYVKNTWYDWNGLRRRAVAFTETTDIEHWPVEQIILTPDPHDDRWSSNPVYRTHFYGLSAFAYESMYIGLLWIFRADSDPDGYTNGPVFAEIVTSRDGMNWEREEGDRPPMLPLGPPGSWDDGQLYTATQPLVEGDTMKLYYGACNQPHGTGLKITTCSIGLSTLRKDGFASLDAGANGGTVTTHTLLDATGVLRVNCTASGGSVRVEVLDRYDNVMPGYSAAECAPLQGDDVDQPVAWDNHQQLPDMPDGLRLRFVLENASLYSFRADGPMRVMPGPKVTQHPQSVAACPGETVSFTAAATGLGLLTYVWQRDGAPLQASARHSGVGSTTLTIDPVYETDAGAYRCVVRDSAGSAASDVARLSLSSLSFSSVGAIDPQQPLGMSSDGSVICGTNPAGQPVIWSEASGRVTLSMPPGATTGTPAGVGIAPDGDIVLAAYTNAASSRAKRWDGDASGAGTWTNLPKLDGNLEWQPLSLGTDGVSDVWIVGRSLSGGDGNGRAAAFYRQSAGTIVSPALPPGGHDHSDFHGVSDTGVAGGQYQYKGTAPTGGARNAMKYSGTSIALTTLRGPLSTSYEAVVKAVSRDGSVAGGWSVYSGGGSRAQPVIWVSTTPTALPFLPGGDGDNDGEVLALSGDGTLAGGYTRNVGAANGPKEAFIWDVANGTRRLQDVLTTVYGLDLAGWTLQEVRSISSDANVLAGIGLHDGAAEGWVVHLGAVAQPPTIIEQPQDQRVLVSETATFSIVATSDEAIAFRWQKDGEDIADGARYQGTQTPTLTITNVDGSLAGAYRCIVSIPCGVAESQERMLVALVRPDFDADNDVDVDDVQLFSDCTGGPSVALTPACADRDLDGDGDGDHDDFGLLQTCFSGAGIAPNLSCFTPE